MLTTTITPVLGMHIMEGYLPMGWAGVWWAITLPFLAYGIWRVSCITKESPNTKLILAMVAAFAFVLSALKMPSVTGSCSHPTGVALGAIIFGSTPMVVMGFIVLLFQALLLAHGGLTTLGANTVSMAIVGPFVAWSVFRLMRAGRMPLAFSVFGAAALSDLATYVTTSLQLAVAFPDSAGGVTASVVKFLSIFALTQIPLALAEGLLSAMVFNLLLTYAKREMDELGFRPAGNLVPSAS